MSSFDLRPELATRLDPLVPVEEPWVDWDDVLDRAGHRRKHRSATFKVAVALALFLFIAGVATATYLIVHEHAASNKPGVVTLALNPGTGQPKIVEALPGGRTAVLWRCPSVCGELTSFDWAPDGRHLAATFDAIALQTPYLGLHIFDLKTGRDIHFPGVNRPGHCLPGASPAWSPDGRRLAFACATGIYTMTTGARTFAGSRPATFIPAGRRGRRTGSESRSPPTRRRRTRSM